MDLQYFNNYYWVAEVIFTLSKYSGVAGRVREVKVSP